MKLLVMSALLALIQASTPTTQQGAHAPPGAHHAVSDKASSNKAPSLQPPKQDNSNSPYGGNTQKTAPAPMPTKDQWGKASVVFTGLLVIVGALGVCYAARTLGKIERQAKANEGALSEIKAAGKQTDKMIEHAGKQADAALLSARAFMSSERAWILVRMLPTGPRNKSDAGLDFVWEDGTPLTATDIQNGRHKVPETVGYMVKNYGRTPGWVTSHWCDAKIIPATPDLPIQPSYFSRPASIFVRKCDDLYAPEADRKNRIIIPTVDLIPVAGRNSFLWVYGIITYRDVWDGAPHETRFCFYWHVPASGDMNPMGFYQEGPEGYNKQT